MAKNVYIANTERGAGMTSVSLGLIRALQESVTNIGFIKPVGQRDFQVGSYGLDQDSVLIEKACHIHCGLQDMSPVTVQKGFPQEELLRMRPAELENNLRMAYDRVEGDKDLVVIEGSGHAAVGSMLHLSNAKVAAMFGARVILVTAANSPTPLADVFLNKVFFEKEGVEVLGVILNRVSDDTPQLLRLYLIDMLAKEGIHLLGVIPEIPGLDRPTMAQVLEALGGRVLNGATNLSTPVGRILVGAMSPRRALGYLLEAVNENLLLITPADRTDLITTAISAANVRREGSGLSGIILTGGAEPEKSVITLLAGTTVPVVLVDDDTYTTASKVNNMELKIAPNDTEKIEQICTMVRRNVDIPAIMELIGL